MCVDGRATVGKEPAAGERREQEQNTTLSQDRSQDKSGFLGWGQGGGTRVQRGWRTERRDTSRIKRWRVELRR